MWYVYVLRNDATKRFYTGVTNDIKRRISQHNKSKKRSIAHFGKYYLVHREEFTTLKEARGREAHIKSYKGGSAFKKLLREETNLVI